METADEAVCRTCLLPKTQLIRMDQTVPYLELLTFNDILAFCTNAPATSEQQQQSRHPMEFVACPSHICLRCSKALQVTYHFLKMVRNSDVILLEQQQQATLNVANNSVKNEPLDSMINSPTQKLLPEKDEVEENHSIESLQLQTHASNFESPSQQLWDYRNVIESDFKSITDTNWTESDASYVKNCYDKVAKGSSAIPQSTETTNGTFLEHDYNNNNNTIRQHSNSSSKTDVSNFLIFNSHEGSNQTLSTKLNEPSVILNDKNIFNKTASTDFSQCEENPFNNELYNLFGDLRQTILYNDENEQFSNDSKKRRMSSETFEASGMCDNNEELEDKANNNLYCDQCDKMFEDISSYAKHITRHEGITPLHCELCKYNSCYPESMRKHYKKKHNIVATNEMLHGTKSLKESEYHVLTYKCSQCPKESDKLFEIKKHLLTNHQICKNEGSFIIDNFNCPECTRQFRDLRGMRIHYICVHVKKKNQIKTSTKFKCEGCEKEFSLKVSLHAHQRICVHPHTFNCKLCSKQLDSFRTYKEHLCSEHIVESTYKCELCGKNFTSSIQLSRHTQRHSDRHYQCDLCPKNYINYCELQLHIEHKHSTKDMQVQCPECGARFSSETRLRAHKNKEHLKSLHECGYCSHKSASVASLRLHQYVHTGMPYKCTQCPKQFSLRSFMQKHSKSFHNIELSNNDLAEMFQRNMGYPSRYDVFTKGEYSLDFPEVIEEDLEHELSEFGLKFNDILQDLSDSSNDYFV